MRTSNVQRRTSNLEQALVERSVGRWTFALDSAFRFLPSAFVIAFCLLPSAFALGAPTQEDVLRSISQNVSEPTPGGGKLLAVVAAGVAVVLLLAVLHQRRQREVRPRAVQHPGRLMKEVMKTVPLTPAELKQLKLLVERKRDEAEPSDVRVDNPLTLILCPSVLVRAMRNPPAKIDRKVIAQLARKLGAHPQAATRGK